MTNNCIILLHNNNAFLADKIGMMYLKVLTDFMYVYIYISAEQCTIKT